MPEVRESHQKANTPEKSTKEKAPRPPESGACCCKKVELFLDRITVKDATSGGVPLLGKLVNDHVIIESFVQCTGEVKSWPNDKKNGIEIDTGETKVASAPLATLKADSRCHVDCEIRIAIYKRSPSEKILAALHQLLSDAAKLTAVLMTLKKSLPLGQLTSPAIDATQKNVDDMLKQAADLWAALTHVGDELMDEFGIHFDGSLLCSEVASHALKNPPAPVKDIGNDHCTFTYESHGHGGDWILEFSVWKSDCE